MIPTFSQFADTPYRHVKRIFLYKSPLKIEIPIVCSIHYFFIIIANIMRLTSIPSHPYCYWGMNRIVVFSRQRREALKRIQFCEELIAELMTLQV